MVSLLRNTHFRRTIGRTILEFAGEPNLLPAKSARFLSNPLMIFVIELSLLAMLEVLAGMPRRGIDNA